MHPLLNILLPGSGLVIGGRIALGLALLFPSVLLIAVVLCVLALFTLAAGAPVLIAAGAAYALLGTMAGASWWWWQRRRRIDPDRVRALHRAAAADFLHDRLPQALAGARAVVAAAPEEAGAWRFLATVAGAAGDDALARRAQRRAQHLDLDEGP